MMTDHEKCFKVQKHPSTGRRLLHSACAQGGDEVKQHRRPAIAILLDRNAAKGPSESEGACVQAPNENV